MRNISFKMTINIINIYYKHNINIFFLFYGIRIVTELGDFTLHFGINQQMFKIFDNLILYILV